MSQPALEEQFEPAAGDTVVAARARSSWELFRHRFRQDKAAMAGYGTYDDTVAALETALQPGPFICGDQFTAADLYVASQLGFMMMFGMLEARPVFSDYVARCTDREAYRRAKQIDTEAGEQLKAQAAQ